jgi:hypothetical protein
VEALWVFLDQMDAAPSLVWTTAFFMSALVAWMIHFYLEDFLQTFVVSFIMYWSIVAANVTFSLTGIIFSADRESNVVWAAGASVCAVTLSAVALIRLYYAIADLIRWSKGAPHDTSGPESRVGTN